MKPRFLAAPLISGAGRCDPEGKKKHVAVTEGERALQIRVKKQLEPSVLLILDFLHVLEKPWRAAYVFHHEGSQEAQDWVWLRAYQILHGDVSQMVKGIQPLFGSGPQATTLGTKPNCHRLMRLRLNAVARRQRLSRAGRGDRASR